MALTDIPAYTDEEYAKAIEPYSGDWTRTDTDHVMELVRRFDRRFIIVHDRYACGSILEKVFVMGVF